MTLSAEEFLRRIVQHVLPRGFVKIRHYGLLANRQRAAKLRLCRRLLLARTGVRTVPKRGGSHELFALFFFEGTAIQRTRCAPSS
jgi:Putative transposase